MSCTRQHPAREKNSTAKALRKDTFKTEEEEKKDDGAADDDDGGAANRIRTPSFVNLKALLSKHTDATLAEVAAHIGSADDPPPASSRSGSCAPRRRP